MRVEKMETSQKIQFSTQPFRWKLITWLGFLIDLSEVSFSTRVPKHAEILYREQTVDLEADF